MRRQRTAARAAAAHLPQQSLHPSLQCYPAMKNDTVTPETPLLPSMHVPRQAFGRLGARARSCVSVGPELGWGYLRPTQAGPDRLS